MTSHEHLDKVYHQRFNAADAHAKNGVWREIVAFLQQWIPEDGRVLDVACDAGYFIRHVHAAERWGTDIRDVAAHLDPGVHFVQVDGLALSGAVPTEHFDVVFTSNYLEHLPSAGAVIQQMREMRRVAKPGGRVIVLQPNIRFVGSAYWDFIDHHVALTDRSLVESALAAGLEVERLVPRFLPYTTKSRLPQASVLVRAYLRFPPAWRLLGKQTLLVARVPEAG